MLLKALEISGFKSFAEKTVVHFTSDVTAIVGPNGCGKSNVVDALRWAMGEQSARSLRGQTMEDMIFNGSEQLAPIGMAEVTALLDNSDGSAPADYGAFGEIAVTRRLFRSGESEYSINRVPCRLRDIVELFLGTGVGNKSYSIIGQGRVEELVNSKPEDRRRIIEEAAGTSRFKSRRQAAEGKMERTRQNLLRVNDIVREVERQLHKIELQARKAERYRNLQEHLKDKELRWAAIRMQGLEREIGERGAEVDGVEDRITSLTATVRAREAECERSRVALLEMDGEIGSSQERLYQLKLEVKGEEQRIGFFEREERELQDSVARAKADAVNTSARLETVASEIADLGKASEDFAQLSLFEGERVTRIEVDVAGLRTRIETLQANAERERELLVDRVGAHSQLTNARRADEERLERLRAGSVDKESERRGVEETLEALDGRRARESTELEQCGRRASEMDERLRRAGAELERAKAALAEHEEVLARIKEELQEARSGLSSLETLQKNFEGYQEGVRAVMFKHQSNGQSDGIYGVVADFIEAPRRRGEGFDGGAGRTASVRNRSGTQGGGGGHRVPEARIGGPERIHSAPFRTPVRRPAGYAFGSGCHRPAAWARGGEGRLPGGGRLSVGRRCRGPGSGVGAGALALQRIQPFVGDSGRRGHRSHGGGHRRERGKSGGQSDLAAPQDQGAEAAGRHRR